MSDVYYFSEWSKGMSCIGPPTGMYIIDANDIGPKSFQWAVSELEIDICGYAAVEIPSGCCMGSYDLENSVAQSVMSSGVPFANSPEEFVAWTPVAAIGSSYCTASYTSENGYPITKYLLDDGICRESWICDKGVLKVSNSSEKCMGEYQEEIKDSQFSVILNSTVYFTHSTINQASQQTVWNGFYPLPLNVIYLNSAANNVGFAFVVIIMFSSILSAGYIINQVLINPQQKQVYIPILICQIITLAASIVTIIFYFFPQTDYYEFLALNEMTTSLQALSSFSISWTNLSLLLAVLNRTTYTSFLRGREHFCYIALTVVHLTLAWTWYVSFKVYDDPLLLSWYSAGTIWIGISLIGNFLCLVLFVYYQLNTSVKRGNLQNLEGTSTANIILATIFQNLNQFNLLLLLSLNIVWFFVCYSLVSGIVLQNDILLQYFELFQWLPIPFNGYISVRLFAITSMQMKTAIKGTNTNNSKHSEKHQGSNNLSKLFHSIFPTQSRVIKSTLSNADLRESNPGSTHNLNDGASTDKLENHKPAREKIGLEKLSAQKSMSTPELFNSSSKVIRSKSNNEVVNLEKMEQEKAEKVEKIEKTKKTRVESIISDISPARGLNHKEPPMSSSLADPRRALSINSKATTKSFKETGVTYSGQSTERPRVAKSKSGLIRLVPKSLSADYPESNSKY